MTRNMKMKDQNRGLPLATMKTKMEVRMKMNGSSLVIPPPLLRMDRTKQRHTQVLIIRWRFPRI